MANILHRPSGDYQRQRWYDWENHRLGYFQGDRLSPEQCVKIVAHLAGYCSLPVPEVRFSLRAGGAWANPVDGRLNFTPTDIKPLAPIHEFAHYANPSGDLHGPQFAINYLFLIAGLYPRLVHERFREKSSQLILNAMIDDAVSYGVVVGRKERFGLHHRATFDSSIPSIEDL